MDDVRQTLIERKLELETELERLTAPPTSGAAVSFGKRVGDGTTEAVERLSTTATARSLSRTISDIDRALAKLEAGSYGICDDCGHAIAADRLEALPAASQCVACAAGN